MGPLIVVKRTEDEILELAGTEPGFLELIGNFDEEPIVLEPYQKAFLMNRRRYRCVEKSRQIGYSWLFAAEAVARCHLKERHQSIFVSYNLADSKEKIQYCAQLHEELPLAWQKKKVVDSKLEIAFESNRGTEGKTSRVSRIVSHPSKAPRGKKGDIYLDELAHYVGDREVYKGSTALILRAHKAQLTICSTPLGKRGTFWEIAQRPEKSYKAYSRQRVPWWLCRFFSRDVAEASRKAPFMGTEERIDRFGNRAMQEQFDSLEIEDFKQEFECIYVDDSYSYFPYNLILSRTNPELELVEDFTELAHLPGRLLAGFDVGRTRDLSELMILQEHNGRKILRYSFSMKNWPFGQQKEFLL